MFPDIQAIGGDYVQDSFTLLPLSGERASAALFFARLVDFHARGGSTDVARWYFRAAVSEFRSIFDLLPADLKARGLSHQWERSPFRTKLDEHPLVAILNKVRNFAVHSAHVRGFGKDFSVTILDGDSERQEDIPGIYIEQLRRQTLGRDKEMSDEALDWFNRQINMWPSHLIVQEAVYQSSVLIHNFLVTARKSVV